MIGIGAVIGAGSLGALWICDLHMSFRLEQRKKVLARIYADVVALRQQRDYAKRLITELSGLPGDPEKEVSEPG